MGHRVARRSTALLQRLCMHHAAVRLPATPCTLCQLCKQVSKRNKTHNEPPTCTAFRAKHGWAHQLTDLNSLDSAALHVRCVLFTPSLFMQVAATVTHSGYDIASDKQNTHNSKYHKQCCFCSVARSNVCTGEAKCQTLMKPVTAVCGCMSRPRLPDVRCSQHLGTQQNK